VPLSQPKVRKILDTTSQNNRAPVQVAMAHEALPAIIGELVGVLRGIGLDRRATSAKPR